jgi:hypothetical protein
MLISRLALAFALVLPLTAHAQLSLLGTSSDQTPATTGAARPGFRLPTLDDLRGILRVPKVELTADENAKLDRLKRTMWKLAGPNEKFDYGDLDDIVRQLSGELGGRVQAEISRRAAQEASRGIFPRVRGRLVDRHISRNYGNYFSMGMREADGRVRGGLQQFLRETGCNVNVPDAAADSRTLTLADLEQFAADAPVLRTIKEKADKLGLPSFTFPNGMGWRDIEAIQNSRIPPNGRMVPRATAPRAD